MIGVRYYSRTDSLRLQPYPICNEIEFDAPFKEKYFLRRVSEKPLIRKLNPRHTNGHRGVMIYPR